MFSRWGAFVYRFRRPVAILAVLVALSSTLLAVQASDSLSSGGWLDQDSESAAVAGRLDTEFGAGKSTVIALFRSKAARADATSAEFQTAIAASVAGLADDHASPGSSATRRPAIASSSAPRATRPMSSSSWI